MWSLLAHVSEHLPGDLARAQAAIARRIFCPPPGLKHARRVIRIATEALHDVALTVDDLITCIASEYVTAGDRVEIVKTTATAPCRSIAIVSRTLQG